MSLPFEMLTIKRTAVDPSGRLGSLYDARVDRLIGHLNVDHQGTIDGSHYTTVQGEIIRGTDDQPQNLLRQLHIDEQLRLSILLNLIPNGGVTSLINDSVPTNECTRLFCYSSINRMEQLPDRIDNAGQYLSPSFEATHIITGVEWGIDVVVVLQLPTEADTIKVIDQTLDKLLCFLLDDHMNITLIPEEENVLERLVSTRVYSNIPELNKLTTVHDVCHRIKEKDNAIMDCPISYVLQPLEWLHPQYVSAETKFIPLSIELNDEIENYVLQRLTDLKTFDAKDQFASEIEQIASKVIEIRRGGDGNIANELVLHKNDVEDEFGTINILLLGETGVGKSTFINAFANYLTFDTLEQAQASRPAVLIPVSFLITTGDNFDEHTVKFTDDVDDTGNEDFTHPGQSVTQHCRSYLFSLKDHNGKKLRIIDTPGFGDTRGLTQDDCNMAHIFDYVKDLSHLNAICFLLKPNEPRLNVFYRFCLMELSSFQKLNSCKNILFCFTNARSTFYTPGDSGPLLRRMLNSSSTVNVPFTKENTFCFDSESFRYLVALQNGISFQHLEREEYEKSWTRSVMESQRLIHYLQCLEDEQKRIENFYDKQLMK